MIFLPSRKPTQVTIDIILNSLVSSPPEPLVLLNPRWSSSEILHAMISTPSSASPTLYHEGYLPLDLPSHIEVIDVRSTLSTPTASSLSLLRELAASVYSSPSSSHACTPAVIVFTSGTTGRPKGAQLSLRSLLFQAYAKLQPPVSYNSGTKVRGSEERSDSSILPTTDHQQPSPRRSAPRSYSSICLSAMSAVSSRCWPLCCVQALASSPPPPPPP